MKPVDVKKEFANLFFDIAGDTEPAALDMLLMITDEKHIVYGSDFPHSPAKIVLSKKRHFDDNNKYSSIRQKIYRTNAMKLIKQEDF